MTKPKKPKQQPQHLTLETLNQLDSALDTKKTIRILNNKYEVIIDTNFRESKIIDIAVKFLSIFQDLVKRPDVTDETMAGAINLLPTLILKEFSDLPIQDFSDVDDLIIIQRKLLDTGVLGEVYPCFPQDKLEEVLKKIQERTTEAGKLMGEIAVKQSLQGVDENGNNKEPETVGSDNQ